MMEQRLTREEQLIWMEIQRNKKEHQQLRKDVKQLQLNDVSSKEVKKIVTRYLDDILKKGNPKEIFSLFDSDHKELEKLTDKIYQYVCDQLISRISELCQSNENKLEVLAKQSDEQKEEIGTLTEKLEKEFQEFQKTVTDKEVLYQETCERLNASIDEVIKEAKVKLQQENNDAIQIINQMKTKISSDVSKLLGNFYRDFEHQLQEAWKKEKVQMDDYFKEANANLYQFKEKTNAIAEQSKRKITELEKKRDTLVADMTQEVIRQVVKASPVKQVNISLEGVKKSRGLKGIFHKSFEKILRLVYLKEPVFLVGPAGCGKNVILKQVAQSLGLDFYYMNDAKEEYKILGFVDASGTYQETQFFKAFTKGGLCMVDELDNADPSVLLLLNSAIGTGSDFYMTFPDGNQYQAHPDFHLVAAANTFGTGASQIYCGRNQLDGASLNRFTSITIDYDKDIERGLVNNKEILPFYWELRQIIMDNAITYVLSTRNILRADKLLSAKCFELSEIFEWTILNGMTIDDLNIIVARIKTNDMYSRAFLQHVKVKYNVDRNAYEQNQKQQNNNQQYKYQNQGYGSYESSYGGENYYDEFSDEFVFGGRGW